jgi:hypothetical protein
MSRTEFGGGVERLRVLHHENPCRDRGLIRLSPYAGRFIMELEEIKKAIEALTEEEKREFFSEIVPEICDESITKEGCRMIFEKKLSGSRYLESFDELYETQKKQ